MGRMNLIGKTATKVIKTDEMISVIYHKTEVVKYNTTTKKLVLNTGGWLTKTTKTRMNQASNQFNLGYSVKQIKGQWLVSIENKEIIFNDDKLEIQL